MSGVSRSTVLADLKPFPIITEGMPLIYEDDDEGDMGEASIHTDTVDIALYGVTAHLADEEHLRVFSNLNLYYSETDRKAYASPDLMVAEPEDAEADFTSYRIGADGPTPLMVGEVLSERTAQQGDLREKLRIYALLGIREYILLDLTGEHLPQRLLLKRLGRTRKWKNEQDPDGGVTSKLGFRIIIDLDGRIRVLNAVTSAPYARPDEAEAEARARRLAEEARRAEEEARRAAEEARRVSEEARRAAEERARALEEELARLRDAAPNDEPKAKKGKGRRRKS
jgi:Uma2 family endonuclease